MNPKSVRRSAEEVSRQRRQHAKCIWWAAVGFRMSPDSAWWLIAVGGERTEIKETGAVKRNVRKKAIVKCPLNLIRIPGVGACVQHAPVPVDVADGFAKLASRVPRA